MLRPYTSLINDNKSYLLIGSAETWYKPSISVPITYSDIIFSSSFTVNPENIAFEKPLTVLLF